MPKDRPKALQDTIFILTEFDTSDGVSLHIDSRNCQPKEKKNKAHNMKY